MCLFWNVNKAECALFTICAKMECAFRHLLFLERDHKGMCLFWNGIKTECDHQNGMCSSFGMCSFWNVFLECVKMESVLFGMCSFWNLIKTECAQVECV